MKEIIKKSRNQPKRRLQHIYDLARTKSSCEGADPTEKNSDPLAGDPEEVLKQTVIKCLNTVEPPNERFFDL